ncbi:MAG: hypothetical protein PGN07_07715 [Aeromicrobium erythreum]
MDESTFTAFKVVGTDGASGACEDLAPTTRFASSPSVSLSTPLKVDVESAAVVTNKPVEAAVDYTWTVDNGGVLSTASTSSSWAPPESASGRVVVLTTTFHARDRLRARRSTASPVSAGAFTSVTPEIIGSGRVGELMSSSVTAVPAATSSNSFWMVDGATRSGAASFVPKLSDAGKQVTLRVIVKRPGRVDTAATITRTIQPGPGYVADGPLETGRVLTYPETVELRAYTDSSCTTATPGYSLITTRQPIVPGSAAGSYLRATVPGGTGTSTCFGPVATAQLNGPKPTIFAPDGLGIGKTLRASHGTSGLRPGQTRTDWQWQRKQADGSWTDVVGATAGELVVSPALAGETLRAQATYSGTGYLPDTKASDGVTTAKGTFAAPKPTIGGEAKVGSTVAASANLSGLPEGAAITGYQWAYGEEIVTKLGTGSSLKIPASAKGQAIYVTVTYSAPGYDDASATSDPVGVGEGTYSAPEVAVSGSPRVGSTLSASFDAAGLPSGYRATYEWQVQDGEDWTAIPSTDGESTEQGETYTPSGSAVDAAVRVKVTFSADGYPTRSVTSDAVTIGNGVIELGTPVISDTTPQVGDVLTATTSGVPDGVTAVTTWGTFNPLTEACDLEQVPSAERTVTATDLDKRLCVKVVASAQDYTGDEATSAPTEQVAKGTFSAPRPQIEGEAKVGATVTASFDDSKLPAGAKVTGYQWYYGDSSLTNIAGATTSSLKIPAQVNGQSLRVRVELAADGYEDGSGASDPVSVGTGSVPVPAVTIDRDARVGSKLTATFDASELPVGYTPSYEWQADYGEGYSAIAKPRFGDGNETDKSYTPSAFFSGKSVRVKVVFAADGYESSTAYSPAVTIEDGTIDLGRPVISDPNPQVGDVLTATTSGVPEGVTPVTTWGVFNPLAETCDLEQVPSAERAVTADDVGKRLCVKVVASAEGYDGDEATSAPTEQVTKGTITALKLSLPDSAQVGQELSVQESSDAPSQEVQRSYAWFVFGRTVPIEGATSSSFTPGPDQADKTITVVVTYSRPGYDDTQAGAENPVEVRKGSFEAPKPRIRGNSRVGQTLTALTDLSALPAGASVTGYQWAVSDRSQRFSDIAGATSSTLKAPPVAAERQVRVTVTYSAPGYGDVQETSEPYFISQGIFFAPKVTVTGAAKVGSTLEATFDSAGLPENVVPEYEWQVQEGEDFVPITNGETTESTETVKTYTPAASMAGKTVRVLVMFVAEGYNPAPSYGEPATVAKGDLDLRAPVISESSPMVGEVLTVEVDAPRGATVKRFWGTLNAKGDCVTIGVEAGSFIPGVADLGRRVCVVVEVSDVDGYEDSTQVASTESRVREPRVLKLSDTRIRKGQTFTISATDLEPGRAYTISVYDRKLTGVAGANGRISRTFTYPAKTATAKRTIAVSQYDGKTRTYYQVVSLTYTAKT